MAGEQDPSTPVRAAFRRWDVSGAGTIHRDDLALVFRGFNQSDNNDLLVDTLSQQIASTGGDVDYEHFIDRVFANGCAVDLSPPRLHQYSSMEKSFLRDEYPWMIDTIPAEWISVLLHRPVTMTTVRGRIDEGATSHGVFVSLAYENLALGSSRGPDSICLKVPKHHGTLKQRCARMYEKEIYMYSKLHGRIASALPVPTVAGVFVDEARPHDCFAIAMEDLSMNYECMSQCKGISLSDGMSLAPLIASFHAEFWSDKMVGDPFLSDTPGKHMKDTLEDPQLLEGWYKMLLTSPHMPTNVDLFPSEEAKTMVRLMKFHGHAICEEFCRILASRRFTLIHGDIHPGNIMKGKAGLVDGYKIIDWQVYRAGSPGQEMVQHLSIGLERLEDYDQLDLILDLYLKTLHGQCAASQVYTMDMLREDWTIGLVMHIIGSASLLSGAFDFLPKGHRLWEGVSALFLRYAKTSQVLAAPEYVIQTCRRLGLEVDPAVPFT